MSMLKDTFEKAVELKEQGAFEAARGMLNRLHLAKPQSASTLAVLADVCWELNRIDEAVTCLQKAAKLKPSSEVISTNLFHCLMNAEREEEAFDEMRRFLSSNESAMYGDLLKGLRQ